MRGWGVSLGTVILMLIACGSDNSARDAARAAATRAGDWAATALAVPTDGESWAATAQSVATAVGDVAATAQFIATTVPTVAAKLTAVSPLSATEVIQTYTEKILGVSITPLYAGGVSGEVQRGLTLPAEGGTAVSTAAGMALVTYGAVLPQGVASVSYGSGELNGDVSIDVQAASLGAVVFTLPQAMPRSEDEALTLVKTSYPLLGDRNYTSYSVAEGYAWVASGDVPGFDCKIWTATLVAERVLVGVSPMGARRIANYAVVGRGDFAVALTAQ